MKLFKNKRLWITILVAFFVLAASVVTLAKTGNLKFLADTLYPDGSDGKITVTASSTNGSPISVSIATKISDNEYSQIFSAVSVNSGDSYTFENVPYDATTASGTNFRVTFSITGCTDDIKDVNLSKSNREVSASGSVSCTKPNTGDSDNTGSTGGTTDNSQICDLTNWKVGDAYPTGCVNLGLKNDAVTNLPKIKGWLCLKGVIRDFATSLYNGNVTAALEWNNAVLSNAQYEQTTGKFTFVNVPIPDGVVVNDLKVRFKASNRETQVISVSDLISSTLTDASLKKASCTDSNDFCAAECYTTKTVSMTQNKEFSITGNVADNGSKNWISGVEVKSLGNQLSTATTDINGNYTLKMKTGSVNYGSIELTFSKSGYVSKTQTLATLSGKTSSATIDGNDIKVNTTYLEPEKVVEIKDSLSLAGKVRFSESGMSSGLGDTKIEVVDSKSNTVASGKSAGDGTYVINFSALSTADRNYSVRATLPDGYKFSDNTKIATQSVTFPAGQTSQLFDINFEAQIIRVRIKVVDAKTSLSPTSEAKVTIYDPYCKVNGMSELAENFIAVADEKGDKIASITGIAAEYLFHMVSGCDTKNGSIYGIADGYSRDASPIESIYHNGENTNSDLPVLYLIPEEKETIAAKTVTVVDENGAVLADAQVVVSPAEFGVSFLKKTTDSNGNVTFTDSELNAINKTYNGDIVITASKDDYYADNNSNTTKIKNYKNLSSHTRLTLFGWGRVPYNFQLQVHVFDARTKESVSENAEVTIQNDTTKAFAFGHSLFFRSSADKDGGFVFWNQVTKNKNSDDKVVNNTYSESTYKTRFTGLLLSQKYTISVRTTLLNATETTKTISYTSPTISKNDLRKVDNNIYDTINVFVDSKMPTVKTVPLQIVDSKNKAVKNVEAEVYPLGNQRELRYDNIYISPIGRLGDSDPYCGLSTVYNGSILSVTKSFSPTTTCPIMATKEFKDGESILIKVTDLNSTKRFSDFSKTYAVKVNQIKNVAETIKIVLKSKTTRKGIRVRKVSYSDVFADPINVSFELKKDNNGSFEIANYEKDVTKNSDGTEDIVYYPETAGKFKVEAINSIDDATDEEKNETNIIDFDPTTAVSDVDLTFAKKTTVCSVENGEYLRKYTVDSVDYYVLFPTKLANDQAGNLLTPAIKQLVETEKLLTGKTVPTLLILDQSTMRNASLVNSTCDSADLGVEGNKWQRTVNIPVGSFSEDESLSSNMIYYFSAALYSEFSSSTDPINIQIASDFFKAWTEITNNSDFRRTIMDLGIYTTNPDKFFGQYIAAMRSYPGEFEVMINNISNQELKNILRMLFEKIYIAYGFPSGTNYDSVVRDKKNFVLTDYSIDLIKKGAAFENTYDSMSATDKIYANYLELTNTMRKTGKVIVENLNAIYAKIDELVNNLFSTYYLSNVGTNYGNVKGKVVDKKGLPVANVIVKIGERYRITDSAGTFSISKLPAGNQPIYVETFANRLPLTIKSPSKDKTLKLPAVKIVANKNANATIKLDYSVPK